MCQDLEKIADQGMFVTFILKHGSCSQTNIPFGFLSVLHVFVVSVTLGWQFELHSSHYHLVSVHKLSSNKGNLIIIIIIIVVVVNNDNNNTTTLNKRKITEK